MTFFILALPHTVSKVSMYGLQNSLGTILEIIRPKTKIETHPVEQKTLLTFRKWNCVVVKNLNRVVSFICFLSVFQETNFW